MNHVLNIFNIYSINLLRFGLLGFSFPSIGGIVLRKTIEFHHPLDFSWYDSPWALFTSTRGWQKIDGTTPNSSSKAWFSCRGSLVVFWLRMNKGWLPTFNPLAGDLFGLELFSISILLVGPHRPFYAWACSLLHEILGPTKWALKTCFGVSFLLFMGFSC